MRKLSATDAALARLQRQAALSVAIATVLMIVASQVLGQTLSLSSAFGAKSLLLFGLALLLFGRLINEHLPHTSMGPANLVTLIRLGLTALLAGLLAEKGPALAWLAVGLAGTALVLDGLDGWLARRGGWSSQFGARFDMETDALLILLMCLLVWQFEKAGLWVVLSGLARYGFVLAAWKLRWLSAPLPPSLRRKFVCVVQLVSLLLALAPVVPSPASDLIALFGLLALGYSFGMDIRWLLLQTQVASEAGLGVSTQHKANEK